MSICEEGYIPSIQPGGLEALQALCAGASIQVVAGKLKKTRT